MTTKSPLKFLVEREAKVLRNTAKSVLIKDIGTKKFGDLLAKMKKAMHAEDDGVAIAAPQVGAPLRIFVVRGLEEGTEDEVYINPEIIKQSRKKQKMEEGCLSLRYLYGFVERYEKVTVSAYDEHGKKRTRGASGLLSQIFQHEIDHLNGVLFTDKAEKVRDLPPTQDAA